MHTRAASALIVTGLIFLGACNKQATTASSGPQATVQLHDGTSFAGAVTASSPTSITLVAPNGETRTYPMSQVDSVQYAQSQTATGAPPATVPAPGPATNPDPNPPAQAYSAPPPAPVQSQPIPERREPSAVYRVIPAGAAIRVRNNDIIDSSAAPEGQTYSGTIASEVVDANGRVVIPRGSDATLVIRSARRQGRVEGQSELVLSLDSVRVEGRRYRVDASDVVEKGHAGVGANKRTGAFVGGGAVLGTILGAVAGGGRGAAIGALSGAAAGGATQTLSRGHGVRIPAESVLAFTLEAPIRINEMR